MRSWTVVDGEKNGGAIVTSGGAGFFTDHKKAGRVGSPVLDCLIQNLKTCEFGSELPPERGSSGGGFLPGKMCRPGCGGNLDKLGIWKIAQDPVLALTEDLGVGIERADFFPGNCCKQVVVDAEQNLGADPKGRVDEEV